MNFFFCSRIAVFLLFSALASADNGPCSIEEYQKPPVYDADGNVIGHHIWIKLKLKTPLRKESHLIIAPYDDGRYYDIYLSLDKVVKAAVTADEAVPIIKSICPNLTFDPPSKQLVQKTLAPRTAFPGRHFGQMSGDSAPVDLNGDGITDSAYIVNNRVNIILYGADSSSQLSGSYAVVQNAATVIAADFNGDGKMDLAVGGDSNGKDGTWLGILLGNGDGTFQAPSLLAAGNGVVRLAAADLNGDGKLDLVAANPYSNKIAVLFGNGDGTFGAPVFYTAPTYPSAMIVADLNNDGRPDVAVLSNYGDQLGVFLSNPDGTLQPALTMPAGHADQALAFGDLNNDGNIDLLGVDFFGNALSVLLGNGDGTFQTGRRYLTATQSPSVSVIPAQDGSAVILTLDGNTGDVILAIADADGTLSTPDALDGGVQLTSVAIGDVNGDGKPDVISTDSLGDTVFVKLNGGTAGFALPHATKLVSSSPLRPSSVTIADVNGDGRGDYIFALNGTGFDVSGIGVSLSDADGTPGPLQRYPVGGAPSAVLTGDFDGDGKLDVAVLCYGDLLGISNGNVAVLLGNGDGTFRPAVNLPSLSGQRPVSFAVADFDGDGRLDLAVATKNVNLIGPGKITIYPGKGDGTFLDGRDVPFNDPSNYPEFLLAADINGDGKMDLVALLYVENPRWVISSFLNQGDGNFTATPSTDTEFGPIAAVAADFDGDGNVDLVVAHCCGLTDTTYLLGNGDGTFQGDVHLSSVPSPLAIASADLDGDGQPDLVVGGNRDRFKGGVWSVLSGNFKGPATLVVLSPKTTR